VPDQPATNGPALAPASGGSGSNPPAARAGRPRGTDLLLLLALVGLLTVVVVGLLGGSGRPPDRAAELDARLRCPVCKSVSIADSPAETASAMRLVVREQVAAGRSDAEILAYFEERYGPTVRLDPPAAGRSLWLWVLPAIAAVAGVGLVLTRSRAGPLPTLSERDRALVAAELTALRRSGPEAVDREP